MSMPSVLFFTTTFGGGGAEMHLLRLLNHLNRDRIRPSLALINEGGTYRRRLAEDVPVHILPTGGIDSTTLRLVRAVRPLRRLIEAERPDVVCSVLDVASIALVRAVEKQGASPKLVESVQRAPIAARKYETGWVEKIHAALEQRLAARAYRLADRVVALSQGVAHEVAALAPEAREHLHVIHNAGLDADTLKQAGAFPGDAHPGKGQALIVACGRLSEIKGFTDLLDAFAMVQDRLPNARLRVLGEGPLRPKLEAKTRRLGLEGRVAWPGFVDDPFRHMAAADLFVLSSLSEGFGNVIVEAMACGAPVVATDCPYGPGEIIREEESGLLVPLRDPVALAEAMLRVLADEALAHRLAAGGRERAQDFHARAIAGEYERLFIEMIGQETDAR